MSQDFKCFIGLHKYEVVEDTPLSNPYKALIGRVYVCRCTNCGKMRERSLYTETNYRQKYDH